MKFDKRKIDSNEYVAELNKIMNKIKSTISEGGQSTKKLLSELTSGNLDQITLNEAISSLNINDAKQAALKKSLKELTDIYQNAAKERKDTLLNDVSSVEFWGARLADSMGSVSTALGQAIASGFSLDGFKNAALTVKDGFKLILISIADALDKMYIGMSLVELIQAFINPASLIINTGKLIAMKLGIEAFKGLVSSFAVGGLITQPTLALMGEAGTELVAPKQDFLTVARELIMNEKKNLPQVAMNNSSYLEIKLTGNLVGDGKTLHTLINQVAKHEAKRFA
jgi:hypothetical protein